MNEIQLIRQQLASERAHAGTVAQICAGTLERTDPASLASGSRLEEFRQACVDYLVCVLAAFEERDRRLGELAARLGDEDPARAALDDVLGRRGSSRDALEKLEAAFAGPPPAGAPRRVWAEFEQFFNGPWSARRDALDTLLALNPRTADWRSMSGIDADAILEERARWARVKDTLPRGVCLSPAPPRQGP